MSRRKRQGIYRDDKVHVCKSMCDTCIFRPGNLMQLKPGRVEQMVASATRRDNAITCHSSIDGLPVVCSGFFKLHATSILQIADRLGYIEYVDPASLL